MLGGDSQDGVAVAAELPAKSGALRGATPSVAIVALDPVSARVPASCAGCSALAASSRVEVRATDGARIIVPYCDACHRAVSRPSTRRLGASVAASVVAFTLATTLPLIFGKLSLFSCALIVVAAALLPGLAGIGRSLQEGHAVFWRAEGDLLCRNTRWAAELAALNASPLKLAGFRPPESRAWLAIAPCLGMLLLLVFHPLHHPYVRFLNLTPGPLTIAVDGEEVAQVQPSSAESERAGAEQRVSTGHHVLEARDEAGHVIAEDAVTLVSGANHLFAPGSDDYCFWLETTRYGRAAAPERTRLALTSAAHFWVLDRAIDSWFSANPAPSPLDGRSTGGVLTALRQAPCREAPDDVR